MKPTATTHQDTCAYLWNLAAHPPDLRKIPRGKAKKVVSLQSIANSDRLLSSQLLPSKDDEQANHTLPLAVANEYLSTVTRDLRDTSPNYFDVWPANSRKYLSPTKATKLSTGLRAVLHESGSPTRRPMSAASTVAKPSFLNGLEAYVSKALSTIKWDQLTLDFGPVNSELLLQCKKTANRADKRRTSRLSEARSVLNKNHTVEEEEREFEEEELQRAHSRKAKRVEEVDSRPESQYLTKDGSLKVSENGEVVGRGRIDSPISSPTSASGRTASSVATHTASQGASMQPCSASPWPNASVRSKPSEMVDKAVQVQLPFLTFAQAALETKFGQRRQELCCQLENIQLLLEGVIVPENVLSEPDLVVHRDVRLKAARVEVFQSALNKFVETFRTYREFLVSVITEFNAAYSLVRVQYHRLVYENLVLGIRNKILELDLEESEFAFHKIIKEVEAAMQASVQRLHTNVAMYQSLEQELDNERTRNDELEYSTAEAVEQNLRLQRELRKMEEARIASQGEGNELSKAMDIMSKDLLIEREKLTEVLEALNDTWREKEQLREQLNSIELKHDEAIKALQLSFKKDLEGVNVMKTTLIRSQKNLQQATEQRDTAEAKVKKIQEQLDQFEAVELTPRPHWSVYTEHLTRLPRSADSVSLMVETIKQLRQSLATLTTENLQMKEFLGLLGRRERENAKSGDTAKFFKGLGTSTDVPKYLRFTGKVRNREMSLVDLTNALKEFWVYRQVKRDKEGIAGEFVEPDGHGADIFMEWLKSKYGVKGVIMEWSYNIALTMKRFPNDSRVKLTMEIIEDRVPEGVWFDTARTIQQLYDQLYALDTYTGRATDITKRVKTGKLSKNQVVGALGEVLVWKSDLRFSRLISAIRHDATVVGTKEEMYNYQKLFQDGVDGEDSQFMFELRAQYLEERDEWLNDLNEHVETAFGRENWDEVNVSIGAMVDILVKVDTKITKNYVEMLISRGWGCSQRNVPFIKLPGIPPDYTIDELNSDCSVEPVKLQLFMNNVICGGLRLFTKKVALPSGVEVSADEPSAGSVDDTGSSTLRDRNSVSVSFHAGSEDEEESYTPRGSHSSTW